MKTYVNQELAKNHSLYEGLNELEAHFLHEEMKKNYRLPPAILIRNAKKRSVEQKIAWFIQETTTLFGIAGMAAFIVACVIIWSI